MTTTVDTSWETLTDYGRSLLDAQDRQRWQLGELVDLVQTHYGESSITKFCEEVKGKPSTLYQYAQVYRFYPRDSWKEYPIVRYTQWREAMKLKDVDTALALIQRANDENMRMADFYAAVKAATEISTACKLFAGEMTVDEAIARLLQLDHAKIINIAVKDVTDV